MKLLGCSLVSCSHSIRLKRPHDEVKTASKLEQTQLAESRVCLPAQALVVAKQGGLTAAVAESLAPTMARLLCKLQVGGSTNNVILKAMKSTCRLGIMQVELQSCNREAITNVTSGKAAPGVLMHKAFLIAARTGANFKWRASTFSDKMEPVTIDTFIH